MQIELVGDGLIRPEMKTDPTCTDSGRFWVQFCSQIGLEFGTEKFDRFGFGFGFNFVVTTVSGLGSGQCGPGFRGLKKRPQRGLNPGPLVEDSER